MNILSTTNYEQFRKIKGNRRVYEGHVKELMESISEKNMLSENPIIVTKDMGVIDGQHRLEAAKRKSWDIYYLVSETDMSNGILEDVQRLQRQKGWTNQDFLESYIEKGVPSYVYLKEFMRRFDLPLSISLRLLVNPKISRSGDITTLFKRGEFQANNFKNGEMMAQRLLDLKPYLEEPVRRDREFINALSKAYTLISHKELLYKLTQTMEKVRQQRLMKDYLRVLEDIYNFHRQKRVRFF